jgi:hypothetical protein
MAFLGTAPFGSLLAGNLASQIGAPMTIRMGGICCLFGSLWFASQLKELRKVIRPIYMKMGILPQVATGIQNTVQLNVPTRE